MESAGESLKGNEEVNENIPSNQQNDCTDSYSSEDRGSDSDLDGLTERNEEKSHFRGEEFSSGSERRSFVHKELSQDCISDILDYECGEPIMSQHLTIDFNPLEGLDDSEYLLNKCMSFWNLVNGNPEIKHFKVLPTKKAESHLKASPDSDEPDALESEFPPPVLECIETIEGRANTVNEVFMTKLKGRYCEEGGSDYFVDLPQNSSLGPVTKWETPSKSTRAKQLSRGLHREEVSRLCRELEEWDVHHPKSMEQPGHNPSLHYAVMQKNQ